MILNHYARPVIHLSGAPAPARFVLISCRNANHVELAGEMFLRALPIYQHGGEWIESSQCTDQMGGGIRKSGIIRIVKILYGCRYFPV